VVKRGLPLAIVVALLTAGPIAAAEKKGAPPPGNQQSGQQNEGGKRVGQAHEKPPVSPEQATYLVRAALLTLNDANRSGNYTVLRDLAAPEFQARNNAADLAGAFADLRRRKFDLFAAALLAPVIQPPQLVENGQVLRLTGNFPTRPLRIDFDLLFKNVAGQWRLYGISVATPQA
jgi:hypothetical protein